MIQEIVARFFRRKDAHPTEPDRENIFRSFIADANSLARSWNDELLQRGVRRSCSGHSMCVDTYESQYSFVFRTGTTSWGPNSWPVVQVTVEENGTVALFKAPYGPSNEGLSPEQAKTVLASTIDMYGKLH